MNHQDFELLTQIYALGALDGEDLSRYEAHLRECSRCREEVKDFAEASIGLALALPPETPPAELREKVLAQTAPAPPPPLTWRERPFSTRWAAAAALLLGLFFWFTLTSTAPPARHKGAMAGNDRAPAAQGFVRWTDADLGVVVTGLPSLPSGKIFHLWVFLPGQKAPTPAGVFPSRSGGRISGAHRMKRPVPEKSTFALSIEDGPVATPTDVVMLPLTSAQ